MPETNLEDFIAGNYLSFKFTNPIQGKYHGVIIEDDPFKKGEKRFNVTMEVEGEEKHLTSKSKRLAKCLLAIGVKKGDLISCLRVGSGFETNFEVKKIEKLTPKVVEEEHKLTDEEIDAVANQ